jgi:hypothetical protein
MSPRTIAVDWSGAQEPLQSLWLAEAVNGRLIDVRHFPTRAGLTEHVVAEQQGNPELIVGLDFAFSLPAWFLRELRIASASELWNRMRLEADDWLRPRPPFWGKGGGKRPEGIDEFRQTDLDLRRRGWRPSSVFKLVGADQVGTGSLRGMPCLERLRAAGFKIWPFAAGRPLVVEIYPGALAAPVGKAKPANLARAVKDETRIPAEWKAHAACSQDAYDAAMSALAMSEHVDQLLALAPAERSSPYAVEGQIWIPEA